MTPAYFSDMAIIDDRLTKLEERTDNLCKALRILCDLLKKEVLNGRNNISQLLESEAISSKQKDLD